MAPMGKPRKKAAAALAASPAMRALKGKAGKKRAAEDKIEQAVSAKKKKVVPPAKPVLPAKEAGAEASKQRPPKEEETSSSVDEEESNSESEEEAAQSTEEESNDDNSAMNSESNEAAQSMEEESNDDNSAMNSESNEDTTHSTIPKTDEKDSSNDEEDAEDDNNEESDGEDENSQSNEEDENSQSNEEDDNSESGEEDENSESDEHDEDLTPKKEAPGSTSEEQDATKEPKTPVSNLSQGKVSKTLFVGNAPFKADIDHIKLFFKEAGSVINVRFPINKDGRRKGVCYVDFESVEAAQKAIELNGREFMSRKVRLDFAFPKVSQESNKKDDNNEESGEQDDSNEESGEEQNATKEPQTPVSTQDQATVSKTLFMGNAPFKADVDQVQHFFKDAGLVIDVRFPLNEDGRRKGFCYVEFASVEAAQKAIELNGREFMSRQVRLDFALEKGSHTPQDGNETGSVQKPARGSSLSIFVKGFDKSLGEDKIRSSLEQHFAECGEITRISIPSDNNTGVIKGIAYMDFKEQESVSKALKLNGSDLGGCELVVDNATPKVDRSGGRRGGGRSGGRGRFGGRDSGRGGRGGRK